MISKLSDELNNFTLVILYPKNLVPRSDLPSSYAHHSTYSIYLSGQLRAGQSSYTTYKDIYDGADKMADANLAGRCGLYCGSCIIYRAERDSQQLREEISRENGCEPEDVHCSGCQSVLIDGWDSDDVWGKNCEIVRCLESKELSTCHGCEVKCHSFQDWYEHMLEYGEDLKQNLKRINCGDLDAWLEEEEEKWSCKACGKPLIINLDRCHMCGESIR